MLKTIEKTILDKLKENFSEYTIDSFPTDFEQFEFTSPKGCILLRYENHKNSKQNTLTAVNSDKTYKFTLFAAVRYAQKHIDCYDFLRELETNLNGLTIFDKRLEVAGSDFEAEINGDLWYSFELSITLPLTDEYKDLSIANNIVFNHIEEKI